MIFFSDLLTGTSFLNTIPISIGAKSTLTDTIEESNTGLRWCASGCAGITVVVIEEQEPEGNLSILLKMVREKWEMNDIGVNTT